jgi:hypothetical protein
MFHHKGDGRRKGERNVDRMRKWKEWVSNK